MSEQLTAEAEAKQADYVKQRAARRALTEAAYKAQKEKADATPPAEE